MIISTIYTCYYGCRVAIVFLGSDPRKKPPTQILAYQPRSTTLALMTTTTQTQVKKAPGED